MDLGTFVRIYYRLYEKIRLPKLRQEFRGLLFSGQAMQKLIDDFAFDTVLDVGSGAGIHTNIFLECGKSVTAIDYGKSPAFKGNHANLEVIIGDFGEYCPEQQFDCIWCSHVLEHQLNVNQFLRKVNTLLKNGGVLCITVPPMKQEIVGGHLSVWNAGLLLYNLIMAGFDCSAASILAYGYNVSVIVEKKSITLPDDLCFDGGDLARLEAFFPFSVGDCFDGAIKAWNW